jgi:hypothetical protein
MVGGNSGLGEAVESREGGRGDAADGMIAEGSKTHLTGSRSPAIGRNCTRRRISLSLALVCGSSKQRGRCEALHTHTGVARAGK